MSLCAGDSTSVSSFMLCNSQQASLHTMIVVDYTRECSFATVVCLVRMQAGFVFESLAAFEGASSCSGDNPMMPTYCFVATLLASLHTTGGVIAIHFAFRTRFLYVAGHAKRSVRAVAISHIVDPGHGLKTSPVKGYMVKPLYWQAASPSPIRPVAADEKMFPAILVDLWQRACIAADFH